MRRAAEKVGMGVGLLGVLAYVGLVLSGLVMEAADLIDPKHASLEPSSTLSTTTTTTTLSTAASSIWTAPSSVTQSSRTPQSVPPADYSHHYLTGAHCRDGWHSDATGGGACSGMGVAEWLYADDRIVPDAKTGDELGTVKWVGAPPLRGTTTSQVQPVIGRDHSPVRQRLYAMEAPN